MRPTFSPRRIAMGCMRLSTDRNRDESRALAVLHAAFDAGITVLDTADAYSWDATEAGHNERLIARALATWNGDRSRIVIATKGGLTRPGGGWLANGRARHLVAACEASRRALGVERIHLYQLHAPDPRTPIATSVRALASLKRDGLIEAIGLCNVNVGQIEESRRIADITSVQVELSIWHDQNILSGVVEYCVAQGILLLAHRPLGGPGRRRSTRADPVLSEVAARHDATAFEIALAWLSDLSDLILPIPGPTRVETARSIARVRRIALTDDDRAVLDTYVSRTSRAAVIRTAWQRGLPVRCMFLATTVEDAQVHAAWRLVSRDNRLPVSSDIRNEGTRDRNAFGPTVQFRYQRELEPPDSPEGFSQVDVMPFERRHDHSFVNRAVIVWCDGVLHRSRSGRRTPASADDLDVFAARGDVLRRYQAEGWRVLGLSWQPEIAEEKLSSADVDAVFVRMRELLGVAIEIEYCPHGAGPPTCWCRKPLPGLGVLFIQRHRLDASQCIYVGAGPQDPGFARRLGFQFREAQEFFAPDP